jgi:Protein of unknown function (DUF1749)
MSNSTADGRLHRYWPERNLTLFEYVPPSTSSRANTVYPDTLLFVGGLYDSFLSVSYVSTLASYAQKCKDWSIMEIQLSSSGLGWGTGNLCRDVEEIGKAVAYVRDRVKKAYPDTDLASDGGKVVLMGHSTGSQDVLHYFCHNFEQEAPQINGAILQAAVSDREGLAMMRAGNQDLQQAYKECLRISLNSDVEYPQGTVCTLPLELTSRLGWPRALVSCKRFLSLASPPSPIPGLDDLFSSDLSDEALRKTFGCVGPSGFLKKNDDYSPEILVLLSADDEYTPTTVNKEALLTRWKLALENGGAGMATGSGVIADASHNVKEPQPQLDLTRRVLGYLNRVGGGVPQSTLVRLDEDYRGF